MTLNFIMSGLKNIQDVWYEYGHLNHTCDEKIIEIQEVIF